MLRVASAARCLQSSAPPCFQRWAHLSTQSKKPGAVEKRWWQAHAPQLQALGIGLSSHPRYLDGADIKLCNRLEAMGITTIKAVAELDAQRIHHLLQAHGLTSVLQTVEHARVLLSVWGSSGGVAERKNDSKKAKVSQ
eukprot:TRINITY_DN10970_c0_g1_i1.p1 TRINITY_DN10970_c0_g1~~TRINITY_DN10970_c0_g1_i1.p1  ORF type:complete len:148 (-),score=21.39 TRINITY_DN10970_c0_g1_i1:84-497(-)